MSIYQSEWSPGRPLRYHLKCDSCDTELVFTGSEEAAQFARVHMARPREEKPDICRACRDIALLKRIESGASRARQRASVGHGARGKAPLRETARLLKPS